MTEPVKDVASKKQETVDNKENTPPVENPFSVKDLLAPASPTKKTPSGAFFTPNTPVTPPARKRNLTTPPPRPVKMGRTNSGH